MIILGWIFLVLNMAFFVVGVIQRNWSWMIFNGAAAIVLMVGLSGNL